MKLSFVNLLALLLIALKLCGVISWGWIWVLCPVWGSAAVALLYAAWRMWRGK